MQKIISGIQQIGIGIPDANEAFAWYRKNFGMDIRVFDEAATAGLMLPYTGGEPRDRHAILAINMQGGGGFEIWQYRGRIPEAPKFDISLGDYGIFSVKLKSRNIKETFNYYKSKNITTGKIEKTPSGSEHFFVKDPYGNLFQVVEGNGWFKKQKSFNGGIAGCIIGVSDIEKSRKLYSDILGYDNVVYDKTGVFEDFSAINGGKEEVRRVLLRHSEPRTGGFSKLLGPSEIELVRVISRKAKKIFEGRLWGDLGFIHLCYDIIGMEQLEKECKKNGFPFTVNSSTSFDMGEAAGHFSYIEDPDGTLIEFVETHKVPVIKKLGWYLNLKKRNPNKALPNWMVSTLSFNRVKD
jgi:catechol 2,3-dioxygenase-like lactoylglutathione lyase family enzyme